MSYAAAAALQAAVYQRLRGAAALGALVGDGIHDAVPEGVPGGTWVAIGPEDVKDASDMTGDGAEHEFAVSVVTDQPGFQAAKAVAAAVSDALVDAPLLLARGRLVGLHFVRAKARRVEAGEARRIDLIFRARIDFLEG